ncbi:hypothetical protein [Paraburkholderia sp. BR14374]|uniref:effector-associated constant component EACC1 n=1 Tax=Paraburkholderia sp. BR14374 TaxID=3237007 RepID=UPI0034CD9D8F
MDESASFEIQVLADTKDTADALAGDLTRELKRAVRGVEVTRQKAPDEENTQLVGTVLVAILGTKAVVELSKGVRAWLEKNQSAKVTIKGNGEIIVENAKSGDVEKILGLLQSTKE